MAYLNGGAWRTQYLGGGGRNWYVRLVNDRDRLVNNWILVKADSSPANTGRLLENGQKKTEGADQGTPAEQHEEEDGPWYFGKAKEEFHKRRRQANNARRGEEEDPIQVCGIFEVNSDLV